MGVADQDFRLVDLKKPEPLWEQYGQNPRTAQMDDQYNHGFVYLYTRAAWEKQPFPDHETIGTTDSAFLLALKKQQVPVEILQPSSNEGLAACGWHRDATCGAKDAPSNVNHSQVLSFMMFRGEELDSTPKGFRQFLPLLKEVAQDLYSRRERHLRDLVDEHGAVWTCAACNFAVAQHKYLRDDRNLTVQNYVTDAYDMTCTYDKFSQKFDVADFSRAGGAVAEGEPMPPPRNHGWLNGWTQRMAICRNCGWQLGWRYEPEGQADTVGGTSSDPHGGGAYAGQARNWKLQPPPSGPVFWALIWRHLRERKRTGEFVPRGDDKDGPRHSETASNRGRNNVCPAGHKLHQFCTGQGNGGAMPLFYICDICDKTARGSEHLLGCGTCDYDICDKCQSRRARAY
eukprot:gnl/TRDRNA2_/TRDRNA2_158565_c2_seq1.p1 gnl/TRDRNA2_/TRDRNA2_158565_c2~~gnl/TRDRNA2_/TRDRNA2_158565_c2_seq1.p1  ORF type:complete len:425 (+),score=67.30 gnl/TRDRNA2_/TRDRNA2_158565_c2_seq1:77-1276(+)